MPPPDKPCIVCGEKASLKCSLCKRGPFCSAKCQRQDWPAHKPLCKKKPAAAQPPKPPAPELGPDPLAPVEACVARKGQVAPTENEVPAGERLVLTITPYASGRCGDKAVGVFDNKSYKDRLACTPFALKRSTNAFRRAVGDMAARRAAADPRGLLEAIAPNLRFVDFTDAGDDFFFTVAGPLDKDERAAGRDAVWKCSPTAVPDLDEMMAEALGFSAEWDAAWHAAGCDPAAARVRISLNDPSATLEPE